MSLYVKLRRYNILAMIVNDADPWCGLGWRVVVVFVGGGWGGGGLGGGEWSFICKNTGNCKVNIELYQLK